MIHNEDEYVKVVRCIDCVFCHLQESKKLNYLYCNSPRRPLFDVIPFDFCSHGYKSNRSDEEKTRMINKLFESHLRQEE